MRGFLRRCLKRFPLDSAKDVNRAAGSVLNSAGGFTLIEILTVLSITLILSALVLAYNRSSLKEIALYREQAAVIGVLNEAKAKAVQKANVTTGLTACAFGVHFQNPNTYILYQAVTSSLICAPSVSDAYDASNPATAIQTFTLDSSVQFDLSGDLDVAFISPNLDVFATYGLPAAIPMVSAEGTKVSIQVGQGGQFVTQ